MAPRLVSIVAVLWAISCTPQSFIVPTDLLERAERVYAADDRNCLRESLRQMSIDQRTFFAFCEEVQCSYIQDAPTPSVYTTSRGMPLPSVATIRVDFARSRTTAWVSSFEVSIGRRRSHFVRKYDYIQARPEASLLLEIDRLARECDLVPLPSVETPSN